jgi:hypothetical protein
LPATVCARSLAAMHPASHKGAAPVDAVSRAAPRERSATAR